MQVYIDLESILFISLQRNYSIFFHFKNTVEVSLHRLVICHQNTAQIQTTIELR